MEAALPGAEHFIVAMAGTVGVFCLSSLGVLVKMASSFRKEKETLDVKIAAIERLMKDELVQKDICKILHNKSDEGYARLEASMNAGFSKLENKVDSFLLEAVKTLAKAVEKK